MARPIFVDGRNLYDPEAMAAAGFTYLGDRAGLERPRRERGGRRRGRDGGDAGAGLTAGASAHSDCEGRPSVGGPLCVSRRADQPPAGPIPARSPSRTPSVSFEGAARRFGGCRASRVRGRAIVAAAGRTDHPDVLLIGAGIMSATLAVLLKQLDPDLKIEVHEVLGDAALESSNAWNNAGTGHAALCELNYTPETRRRRHRHLTGVADQHPVRPLTAVLGVSGEERGHRGPAIVHLPGAAHELRAAAPTIAPT